ncbi:hypothetical protein ACLOJK_012251 [Asimina triloba]
MGEEAEKTSTQQRSPTSTRQHHFVLVHGICHGAWCWYKITALLEKAGHRVSAVDLVGAGIDRDDADAVRTFAEYNMPLEDLLLALPQGEKVILVGHSAGGLSLTHAIRTFPDKIELAVYVSATMLRSGFCGPQDLQEGVPNLIEYGNVFEESFGLGHNLPPTSSKIKKEFLRKIFYQLSPVEWPAAITGTGSPSTSPAWDAALGSMLMRSGPSMALITAKFEAGEERVDEVKRVCIKSSHDLVLKPEQQDAMIKRWPPSQVYTVEGDHSPFFSAPAQLVGALIQAAASI